jgi:hypothetical protein
MIYTISKNYLTLEQEHKRNYPNGGKNKTNAEERQDEESYHIKPNKKQKKGGALPSTLAKKNMEDEIVGTIFDVLTTQPVYRHEDTTNVDTELMERVDDAIKEIKDEKKATEHFDKRRIKKAFTNLKSDVDDTKEDIKYFINWVMKKKPKYLSLSESKKDIMLKSILKGKDKMGTVQNFNKILEKYNIEYDYDNSIAGQVHKLYDDKTNFVKNNEGKLKPIRDRGICFEEIMLTHHQDIVKKCCSKSKQPKFLPSDDQPKIKGIRVYTYPNSPLLSKYCLYDAFNKYCEIEFKFYDNDNDYIDIQITKFVGNDSFTPYFCKHKGKYLLYNIWCDDIDDWLNDKNFKEVTFCAYTNDAIYSWSLTNYVNSDVGDLEINPSKIGPNGEELRKIEFDRSNRRKRGIFNINQTRTDGKIWLKIPIKSMDKLT